MNHRLVSQSLFLRANDGSSSEDIFRGGARMNHEYNGDDDNNERKQNDDVKFQDVDDFISLRQDLCDDNNNNNNNFLVTPVSEQHMNSHNEEGLRPKANPESFEQSHDETPKKLSPVDEGAGLILRGHTQGITSVAFSPDGFSILTGSRDGTAKCWDALTGQCFQTLVGHSGPIHSVSWCPTITHQESSSLPLLPIRLVVTGSMDTTARIWNILTGNSLQILKGHPTKEVSSVAWSPNARYIASGTHDSFCHLWNPKTGVCLITLQTQSNNNNNELLSSSSYIHSLAWSPDSSYLILAQSNQPTLQIWNVPPNNTSHEQSTNTTCEIVAALASHDLHHSSIFSVAWSPNGKTIVVAGTDNHARLWDVSSLRRITGRNNTKTATTTTTTATVPCTGILIGHKDQIHSVVWSPDSSTILTGSNDSSFCLWNAKTCQCTCKFSTHHTQCIIQSVAWSPDGSTFCTASEDGIARTWNMAIGARSTLLVGHTNAVNSVAWSPNGLGILTGSADVTAKLWDSTTGECIATLRHDTQAIRNHNKNGNNADETIVDWINDVSWSPNGMSILTGSANAKAQLWDVPTEMSSMTLSGYHKQSITSVAWSNPSGSIIATGSADATARLWNSDSGECIGLLRGHSLEITDVAFSLSCFDDNDISFNNNNNGNGNNGNNNSNNGNNKHGSTTNNRLYLATASADQSIKIWNVSTRKCIKTLHGHESSVTCIAWCPNSDTNKQTKTKSTLSVSLILISGSTDETMILWNVVSGQSLHRICVQTTILSLSLLNNNHDHVFIIAGGCMDGQLRLWNTRSILYDTTTTTTTKAMTTSTTTTPTIKQQQKMKGFMTKPECIGIFRNGHQMDCIRSVQWSPKSFVLLSGSDNETARIWDLSTFVGNNGMRLDSNYASLPMSPLTLNDLIDSEVYDIKQKTTTMGRTDDDDDDCCTFSWFSKLTKESIHWTLESDLGRSFVSHDCSNNDNNVVETVFVPSEQERHHLNNNNNNFIHGSSFPPSWDNPIHHAIMFGEITVPLVRQMLRITPYEATQCKWARNLVSNKVEHKSLLMRALEIKSLRMVKLILSVFTELLTMPPPHTTREFVHGTSSSSHLQVFKGNDCPNIDIHCRTHCADSIDIIELCTVAESYPEAFLAFVKTLSIVPNYKTSLTSMMRTSGYYSSSLDALLVGTHERVLGISNNLDMMIHNNNISSNNNSSNVDVITREEQEKDQFQVQNDVPFHSNNAHVALTLGLIPLRAISSIIVIQKKTDGQHNDNDNDDDDELDISPFLKTVVHASTILDNYSIFENEVIQYLIEYKWNSHVRGKFMINAIVFLIQSVLFLSNAIFFQRYALEKNNESYVRIMGFILLGSSSILTIYLMLVECQRILKKSVLYFFDGWNILNLFFLTTVSATIASQIYDLVLISSIDVDVGWNKRTNMLAAASMPLFAFRSLFYLKVPNESGAVVRMIIHIMSKIKMFLLLLFLFLLMFTNAFYLLFQPVVLEEDNINAKSSFDDTIFDGAYTYYHRTLLTVFYMMFGNSIYLGDDLYQSSSPGMASALLVLFLFVIVILLLNMLIVIMGDVYDEAQESATVRATYIRAKLILEYESLLTQRNLRQHHRHRSSRWFPTWIQVLMKTNNPKHNRISTNDNNSNRSNNTNFDDDDDVYEKPRKWEGRIKAVTRPMISSMASMKKEINSIKSEMNETMQNFFTKEKTEQNSNEVMEQRLAFLEQQIMATTKKENNNNKRAMDEITNLSMTSLSLLEQSVLKLDEKLERSSTEINDKFIESAVRMSHMEKTLESMMKLMQDLSIASSSSSLATTTTTTTSRPSLTLSSPLSSLSSSMTTMTTTTTTSPREPSSSSSSTSLSSSLRSRPPLARSNIITERGEE